MEDTLNLCRTKKLRVTTALKAIISVLTQQHLPVSLADLENHPDLIKICDRTTIFRTLHRLEDAGLLRRLNFSERGAKFTLKTGHSHNEYLICEGCGLVEALDIACPVHRLEEDLAKETGFAKLHHELEFYGLCKECQ